MDPVTITYLSIIGIGALITLLGIPLFCEKVKPNIYYGFRTKKTLSDPKIWYKANKVAGKGMIVTGLIILCSTLIISKILPETSINQIVLTELSIVILSILGLLIYSFKALKKL